MPVLRLELIIGCMFAGKTSELIRRARRLKSVHDKVLIINHAHDTRTCESVKTHDDVRVEAVKVTSLMSIINDPRVKEADAICIDEGQFFNDIEEFIIALEQTPKTIIIAALDGNWNRKPFRHITDLVCMADSVLKMHALERRPDGTKVEANFSQRIAKDKESQILVGASESYRAVCRETYLS